MKAAFWLLISLFCLMAIKAQAVERQVMSTSDTLFSEGTLRRVLHDACDTEADDVLNFTTFKKLQIRITLAEPLVIPRDCKGQVIIRGPEVAKLILDAHNLSDGGEVPGDSCTLHVYDSGHIIENVTFVGNERGAGICLFGSDNIVRHNRFGSDNNFTLSPNRYGVVISDIFASQYSEMNGANNQVRENTFAGGSRHGIWSQASAVTIAHNTITATLDDALVVRGDAATITQNTITEPLDDGLVIRGDHAETLNNIITASEGDGLVFYGDDGQVKGNQVSLAQGKGLMLTGDRLRVIENNISDISGNGLNYEGDNTAIQSNQIQLSQGRGMELSGDDLEMIANTVQGNASDGVWIRGHHGKLVGNRILANGGCPAEDLLPSHSLECLLIDEPGGVGVLIAADSSDFLIGGPSYTEDRNIIQYNAGGGLIILGDTSSRQHTVSHNQISKNYGPGPDWDLEGDGITLNDPGDKDSGPNNLLNYIEYIQAFPLVDSPDGTPRYWNWGLAKIGSSLELYAVALEDAERERLHGGGDHFLGDAFIEAGSFAVLAGTDTTDPGWMCALTFDTDGNTSEYSNNVTFGPDQDLDGIIDVDEDSESFESSSPELSDTDGDGLPDSIEDINRNGIWDKDEGETSAYLPDSDGDGINDWNETHGDGRYDSFIDTNPLVVDTDGDGLSDGMEDFNGNGTWEAQLNETNPLDPDSDGDRYPDALDSCPALFNPGQEPWFCAV